MLFSEYRASVKKFCLNIFQIRVRLSVTRAGLNLTSVGFSTLSGVGTRGLLNHAGCLIRVFLRVQNIPDTCVVFLYTPNRSRDLLFTSPAMEAPIPKVGRSASQWFITGKKYSP